MTQTAASVIVVSRHRPEALQLCLKALVLQDHPLFEIVVVADPAGLAAARQTGFDLKTVLFDQANISAARNLGLAQAAAPIVAFIDDDAVADPFWLSRLVAPFEDPAVIASTGFVRGRNGISLQWQAGEVDAAGLDHPLPPVAARLPGQPGRAVKTQGTNCAFRKSALLAIGGFDPALHFYLDEADVNLRLVGHGLTAIVPEAQVHHAYAASARRGADRIPLSLQEIAASIAVFLRRHAPEMAEAESVPAIEAQRARVAALLRRRTISQDQASTLLTSLADGWDDGMRRQIGQFPDLAAPPPGFLRLAGTGPRPGRLIAGRIWQKAGLLNAAAAAAGRGEIVTVLCLSPTPRAHHVVFDPRGFWLQSGGLFGWSDRTPPRLRLQSFSARLAAEARRIAPLRPIDRIERFSAIPPLT